MRSCGKALGCTIAGALTMWGPSPALATHVACGATVTQDTTLDSDLVDCPGNGLFIEGDGVTLDLAGHSIDGNGRSPYGVVNLQGSSGVTVAGGRVRQFHVAVDLGGVGPFAVRDLELSESHVGLRFHVTSGVVQRVVGWGNDGAGINMSGARNVLVTDSMMVANASGVGGTNVTLSRVERSVFDGNTFHGARLAGLTDSQLVGNRVRGNGTFGLLLEDGSAGNLLLRNRVSGSGADGIALADDSGAQRLTRNRSDGNDGDGFDLTGSGAALVGNRADRNAGLGFDAPLGAALDLHNSARQNGDPRQCVGVDCDRRWAGWPHQDPSL